MSVGYTWVQWNRHKRVYDGVLLAGVMLYLLAFIGVSKMTWTGSNAIGDEVLIIRGLGTLAILLLHVVLLIGPLARLDRRFLPLLYNRRHLGVVTFCAGGLHGTLALLYYNAFGTINPVVSLLSGNTNFRSLTEFPFELLGIAALVILFFMAATSHDFWNRNLGPAVWKTLHMLVYVAYALLVLHVALGVLQKEESSVYVVMLGVGVAIVAALHLATGVREWRRDRAGQAADPAWIDVGSVDDIEEGRAAVVCLRDRERVAVFKYGGAVSAVSNVCRHQGGPLGEGKIVDGCVTCPWHGWQYRPGDGQSPPPFEERIETYQVRLEGRRILLDPKARAPGTAVQPARIDGDPAAASKQDEFYVGYLNVPAGQRRFLRLAAPGVLAVLTFCGAALAIFQADPGPAVWAYGTEVHVEGIVLDHPYAMLVTERNGGPETILLVGEGKFGAVERVRAHAGRRVRITGVTLSRRDMRLLELSSSPEAVVPIGNDTGFAVREAQGRRTVRGEIIDPKCYFGAMKPAFGKTHKTCAILCIRGGIPPMLVSYDASGLPTYHLLTDATGEPANELVIPFVGEPVEISGEVLHGAGLSILRIDEDGIRRR